ncbi:hypothetical protein CRV24_002846 [Beauveria bassiana]|nr:hypothetical protein CRV24_002846 [Beauveria bassiana]
MSQNRGTKQNVLDTRPLASHCSPHRSWMCYHGQKLLEFLIRVLLRGTGCDSRSYALDFDSPALRPQLHVNG